MFPETGTRVANTASRQPVTSCGPVFEAFAKKRIARTLPASSGRKRRPSSTGTLGWCAIAGVSVGGQTEHGLISTCGPSAVGRQR